MAEAVTIILTVLSGLAIVAALLMILGFVVFTPVYLVMAVVDPTRRHVDDYKAHHPHGGNRQTRLRVNTRTPLLHH